MCNKSLCALTAIVVFIALAGMASGQSKSSADQTPRTQTTKPGLRGPVDSQQKTESDRVILDSDEMMRQTLGDLSRQVALLAEELRKLRRQGERNTGIMELLLNEERLSKVEDKIQETQDQKALLDQREFDLQRRMKNIQGELLFRGAVRRDEAEAAIRADLQRALDEVHNQQSTNHQRLAELQSQAERLRQRVDGLRKKVEPVETTKEQ